MAAEQGRRPTIGSPASEQDTRSPAGSAASELARYYDLDMVDQAADIDLYLALARAADGPVLELAAGSGRVCIPLAAAGHRVTGVDRDPAMLDRARGAWRHHGAGGAPNGAGGTTAAAGGPGSLELVDADLLALDLGRRFALVILALNSLLMLPGRDAQLAALRTMAAHLAPDGRAVIDIVLPAPEDLLLYDGRVELAWQRTDEERGEQVAKLWSARYEPAASIARIVTTFDAWPAAGGPLRRVSRSDEMHLLGAHELLALAEKAGLRAESVGGDHEMGPFAPDSPRIVLVVGLL